MKAVCISDTHNYHNDVKLPDADILIHAGDFTMVGSLSEVLEFNEWLGKQEHSYKVVIAGNHDKCLGENETLGFKMITNAIYLQNSGTEIEGKKIWGSPMTHSFEGMRSGLTFHANRDGKVLKKTWNNIPDKLDILLTHGPPFAILDEVENNFNPYFNKENCGDGLLAAKVIEKKPRYHVFGHIHEGYGQFISDYGTTFINCSVIDEAYNLVNEPIVIDI